MRNYINLSDIVGNLLLTKENEDFHKYTNRQQLMTYGKECLRSEVGIEMGSFIKSVKLSVNTELYIIDQSDMPNDYVDWTKVGMVDGNNNVRVLYTNNKINIAGEYLLDNTGGKLLDADGVELLSEKELETTNTNGNDDPRFLFFNNYTASNLNNGRLYGLGGGNNKRGYFRFNKMDNRFDLDPNFSYDNGIILEYIADESIAANPVVPIQAEAMVREYIYLRAIMRKSSVPQNEKIAAERRFYREKKKTNVKMKMFSKAEALQQINRRFQLAPKFAFE